MNKNNNTILLIICISLLIAFVLIAIVFSIWPGHTFISQIVAALASAMVVSIITLLLLKGQTANEEIKERNTKVFQEKLKIYNDFYQKLCGIVNDGKITPQEEIELQFQVATLTMHTEANNIAAISEQVKELITLIKHPDFSRKLESHNILKPLFEIDKVFRKELYGNDFDLTKDNQCAEDRNCAYEKAYNNFMSIVVNNADIDAYNQA